MKVIFLDIDGVLNAHNFNEEAMCSPIDAEKMERLNQILRATNARLVLSSAWRYLVHNGDVTLNGIEWLLRSHGLMAGRLEGITRQDIVVDSVPAPNERGRQILDWLAENKHVVRSVVIDDLDIGISEAGHLFVQTDGNIGLADEHVVMCIDALEREVGA